MNIAYVRSSFPKNSETFILEEILHLKREGHKVRIYSRWCELSNIHAKILENELLECVVYDAWSLALYDQAKIVPKFLRRYFFQRGYKRFFRQHYLLGRNLTAELQKYLDTRFARSPWMKRKLMRPLEHLKIWLVAARLNSLELAKSQYLLRQENFVPDHIHCPFLFEWDTFKVKSLTEHYPEVPYTVTLRSRDVYLQSENPKYTGLRKSIIEKASQVFTISKYNKQQLSAEYNLSNEMQIIHSSIDSKYFSPVVTNKKVPGQILCVARLVPKKGLEILIEACALLKKEKADFKLVIVGDGPLKENLLKKISENQLTEDVSIVGPFPQSEVKSLLEQSSIFALPCVVAADGDRDMLPNSLKESMAMQLATVTSRISGIEELITDGVDGLLCEPNNADDLADKLNVLLRNSDLIEGLGIRARQQVLANFSILGEGAKLCKSFRELSDPHSPTDRHSEV